MNLLKKLLIPLLVFAALTGCSGTGGMEGAKNSKTDLATDSILSVEEVAREDAIAQKKTSDQVSHLKNLATNNRMVIYNAQIRLEVERFQKVQREIERLVQDEGGYIVQENIYENEGSSLEGTITARIPQDKFQAFLKNLEKLAVKVHNRNITGQDVTEEYVDLEARLKSKQAVEERLYQFLKEAKDTKDLLAISNDLARVQEEIEQIKGRMNYLKNQSSLSTVTIHLFENKVVVPHLENEQLNTWEKTKKQFMSSINFLLMLLSGLVILTVGGLPIFIIIAVLVVLGIYIWKRKARRNKQHKDSSTN